MVQRFSGENHWLLIKAEGRKSNRHGIGAKIKITAAAGAQYNHVTTAVGCASSSDRRVHLGLGRQSVVNELEIKWPSGIRQAPRDVPAGRVLIVREP